MFTNYFLTAFRNIYRHKVFSVIVVLGLTIGVAVFGLILQYVKYERSYDKFNLHYGATCLLESPDWALTGTAYWILDIGCRIMDAGCWINLLSP